MAYPTVAFFQGIPSVYALLPSKHQKRRTATNIMAGHFDPLPAVPSDFERDGSGRSSTSSASTQPAEPPRVPEGGKAGRARAAKGKGKGKQSWTRPKVRRATDARDANAPKPRRVVPAEKEIAGSDTDSVESLSPPCAALDSRSADRPGSQPKASGFWRARSSIASEAPAPTPAAAPSAMRKRKRSGDDEKAPETKRTLRRDLRSPPRPPVPASSQPPANPSTAPGSAMAAWASTSPITSLDSEPGAKSDVAPESSGQVSPEKMTKAVQPHIIEMGDGRSRCKICRKVFRAMHFMERHFVNKHPTVLEPPEERKPTPPPPKPVRGPRKNVAVRKGWKGWVEEDLEPQKLILLDAPEVLPERTTRSGRKI